jgi:mycothiol synthase
VLANALSQSVRAEDDVSVSELESWFDVPDLVMLVAELADGSIAGYADLADQALEHERFSVDLRVPPREHDESIAAALLDAMERRAVELATGDASVRVFLPSTWELGRRLVGHRGYEPFRHSFRMQIDFAGDLPDPLWPEGLAVRTFVPGQDDEAVYAAQDEAFVDHFEHSRQPYESWRGWAFGGSFDPSLWFLAVDGDEIAGVSLCRGEGGGGGDLGWVNSLGVRGAWRRRGLGRALLLHSFAEFRARGRRGAGLGVDALNPTGAVSLYEGAGMYVACRFDQYAKTFPA